jgi:pyrroline-5-carboxylate reductase
MKIKTGIIGAGRITRIFLQALKNRNVALNFVTIFDVNNEVVNKLKCQFPEIETGTLETVASQDMVIIALHPPVIMETLEKIKLSVNKETIVVSLAPKITSTDIAGKLEGVEKIIRLIPNATSVINEGYNPVCFSDGFSKSEKNEVLEILGMLGETFETQEKKLESYAIVSAMAPTYFWFQWSKLVEIGVEIGLESKESEETVYKTMVAALNTLLKSKLIREEVLDLIPVRPLGKYETDILNAYDSGLIGLYKKLTS